MGLNLLPAQHLPSFLPSLPLHLFLWAPPSRKVCSPPYVLLPSIPRPSPASPQSSFSPVKPGQPKTALTTFFLPRPERSSQWPAQTQQVMPTKRPMTAYTVEPPAGPASVPLRHSHHLLNKMSQQAISPTDTTVEPLDGRLLPTPRIATSPSRIVTSSSRHPCRANRSTPSGVPRLGSLAARHVLSCQPLQIAPARSTLVLQLPNEAYDEPTGPKPCPRQSPFLLLIPTCSRPYRPVTSNKPHARWSLMAKDGTPAPRVSSTCLAARRSLHRAVAYILG